MADLCPGASALCRIHQAFDLVRLLRGSALAGGLVCHDGGEVEVCEPKVQNPCALHDAVGCDAHPEYGSMDWHLLKNNEPYPGGALYVP